MRIRRSPTFCASIRLRSPRTSFVALALPIARTFRSIELYGAQIATIKLISSVASKRPMPRRDIKRSQLRESWEKNARNPPPESTRAPEKRSAARSRQRADRVGARVTRSLAVTMAAATLWPRLRNDGSRQHVMRQAVTQS